MQISIDIESIKDSINQKTTESIADAFDSYTLKNAIATALANSLTKEPIVTAITAAVSQVDVHHLTQVLAAELQRVTISTCVHLLQQSVFEVVCKLRDLSNYSESDKPERQRLYATIFNTQCNQDTVKQ